MNIKKPSIIMADKDTDNKYKEWVFTWNSDVVPINTLVSPIKLKNFLQKEFDSYVFQLERGEKEGRDHYQGYIRCKIRTRHQTLLNKFKDIFGLIPDITIDERDSLLRNLSLSRMCGTREEAISYCTKSDTAIPDTIIRSKDLEQYNGEEIGFLSDPSLRYPWQNEIMEHIFTRDEESLQIPDDRTIMWITDTKGNSGKSKFIKYLCFTNNDIVKISFGTAGQLRSSIISIGPRKVYIVDMPRTLGDDDSVPSLLSAIEDIKNGYVVSSMYGKHQQLMMDPPHVIIFSNIVCPIGMMSEDRWRNYQITETKFLDQAYTYIPYAHRKSI